MTANRKPLYRYWTPKHWPTWLGMGLLRLLCLLPHRAALAAGRGIGRLAHRIGGLEKSDGDGNVCYDSMNHEHMCELRAAKIAKIATRATHWVRHTLK